VLDQLSKKIILDSLAVGDIIEILPVLNITLIFNGGAAFSFLNTAGGWQRWLFISVAALVSIAIIVQQLQQRQRPWPSFAMALILGGALGNLWDRLIYGMVIDFIQLHLGNWYYPIFNFADAAITIGAVMLIIDILRGNNKVS
jgi:signal peptidase II